MRHLVEAAGLEGEIGLDSAGTASYHAGSAPDRRSAETALTRGIELRGRARGFEAEDFDEFDYVIAIDRDNLRALQSLTRARGKLAKLHLLRDFDAESPRGSDVPDPYYGGPRGFDIVFDLCEAGCRGLLDQICRDHGLAR